MIETLAKSITSYYITHNIATEQDRDYITYGLQAIFTNVIQIILLIFCSLILHTFWQTILFTASYSLLRQYIGGGHSKTHLSCVIIYTSIAIASSLFATRAHPVLSPALDILLLLIFTVFLVFWRAPLTYIEDRKSSSSLAKLKQKSRFTICIQTILLMCLIRLETIPNSFIYSSTLGIFVAGCTLLPLKYFQVD